MATTDAIEQRLKVAFLAYESGLVHTFGGWLFLILRTVDSLIQARTNISPIGMFSQTAKHTITTIDSIFGKKWLILICTPLYIVMLWWWIGRMSYFEFMKCELSAPLYSEHELDQFKQALLYSFSIMKFLTKYKAGRIWTNCELRRFGRWRKHRYRQEGKLRQRLRNISRVRPRHSSCVR